MVTDIHLVRLLLATLLATLFLGSVARAEPQVLLARGSEWEYLDNGSTPDDWSWTSEDFAETWARGKGIFGYGDSNVVTPLKYGSNARNKAISYFFRRKLRIDDAGEFKFYLLRLLRDDAAVVHINGREVFRSNLPPGPLTPQTHAISIISGEEEIRYHEIPLAPSAFKAGENVIAVHVHQRDGTSSDMAFDLELAGVSQLQSHAMEAPPAGWYGHFASTNGAAFLARRPTLLYFYNGNNSRDLEFNGTTLNSDHLEPLLGKVAARYAVDVAKLTDRSLLHRQRIVSTPTLLLVNGSGQEIWRLTEMATASQVRQQLEAALREHYPEIDLRTTNDPLIIGP